MEEEANHGGAHPRILGDDLGHDRPNDGLQVGARRRVEGRRQLRAGGARQQRKDGDREETTAEGSHA